MQATQEAFDTVSFLSAYEDGKLSPEEVTAGFQKLIDNGLVWQLQGSYGQAAQRLIERGDCVANTSAPSSESRNIGPYVGVSKDYVRRVGSERYRVLLYAAYNAMGLIGYEKNGIAILSEDRLDVVCDEIGIESSGYYGVPPKQAKLFEQICTCSDEAFRKMVNASSRARYTI